MRSTGRRVPRRAGRSSRKRVHCSRWGNDAPDTARAGPETALIVATTADLVGQARRAPSQQHARLHSRLRCRAAERAAHSSQTRVRLVQRQARSSLRCDSCSVVSVTRSALACARCARQRTRRPQQPSLGPAQLASLFDYVGQRARTPGRAWHVTQPHAAPRGGRAGRAQRELHQERARTRDTALLGSLILAVKRRRAGHAHAARLRRGASTGREGAAAPRFRR